MHITNRLKHMRRLRTHTKSIHVLSNTTVLKDGLMARKSVRVLTYLLILSFFLKKKYPIIPIIYYSLLSAHDL